MKMTSEEIVTFERHIRALEMCIREVRDQILLSDEEDIRPLMRATRQIVHCAKELDNAIDGVLDRIQQEFREGRLGPIAG